jgi:hypothetical protein
MRWPQWLTVALVSGLVSIITGALGLAYDLFPNLKPDPGERQVASASILATERAVSLMDYAARIGVEAPGHVVDPSLGFPGDVRVAKCLPGDVYYVQQNLQGFKDRKTSMRFFTYRVGDGRLKGVDTTVSGGRPILGIKHRRTTDQSVIPIWVRWPHRDGEFFVRFALFHGDLTDPNERTDPRDIVMLSVVDGKSVRVTEEAYDEFFQTCFNKITAGP